MNFVSKITTSKIRSASSSIMKSSNIFSPVIAKRGIVTYANPKIESSVKKLALDSPILKNKLQLLDLSRLKYNVVSSDKFAFQAMGRKVKINLDHWNKAEGTTHEFTHASQYDKIAGAHGEDVANQVFDQPKLRYALEPEALIAGKMAKYGEFIPSDKTRRESGQLFQKYQGHEGYGGSGSNAIEALQKNKFLRHSRDELSRFGVDLKSTFVSKI